MSFGAGACALAVLRREEHRGVGVRRRVLHILDHGGQLLRESLQGLQLLERIRACPRTRILDNTDDHGYTTLDVEFTTCAQRASSNHTLPVSSNVHGIGANVQEGALRIVLPRPRNRRRTAPRHSDERTPCAGQQKHKCPHFHKIFFFVYYKSPKIEHCMKYILTQKNEIRLFFFCYTKGTAYDNKRRPADLPSPQLTRCPRDELVSKSPRYHFR